MADSRSMMFGPGSLLFESYGDRRGYLLAPVEGLLQLMHPALGRGVEEHSAFYDEPLERLFRSVPQIQGTIFDGKEGLATARRIREFHNGIRGEMPDSGRYHALDPETFFWAHATFVDAPLRSADLYFARPYTFEQKAAFYEEGKQWWAMYGMSSRVVPPSYPDFLAYWDHMIRDVLEPTPAARALVEYFRNAGEMPQPWLPEKLWRLMGPTASQAWLRIGAGALPPSVREMFDLEWTRANQQAFEVFRKAVARTWPVLPYHVRIMPRARRAYRRDGRIGLRAALDRVQSASATASGAA